MRWIQLRALAGQTPAIKAIDLGFDREGNCTAAARKLALRHEAV